MNKMNLPNKLTVFRMILILPFVVLLLGGYHQWGWFTAIFWRYYGICGLYCTGYFCDCQSH